MGVRCIRDLLRGIKHFEDPTASRRGSLYGVVDVHEVVNRAVEVAPVTPVGEQSADGKLPAQDEKRAPTQHQHVAQMSDPADHRKDPVAQGDRLYLLIV